MNLDVCRKCKRLFMSLEDSNTKKYCLHCFKEKEHGNTDRNIAILSEDEFNILNTFKSCFIVPIYNTKELYQFEFLNNITVNNECPYKFEHDLYNWNKNES